MTHWEAALLGIIQGLTEFLPVSSSGHLELGKSLFGLSDVDLTFSVLVHGATACSTLVVFRKDIAQLIVGVFNGKAENAQKSRVYVGWLLCVTALILFLSERMRASARLLNLPRSVAIGLAQAMAIIPGISRSGTTIGMAIAMGVSREEAARFSFLMALPVILGATLLEVLDLIQEPATAGGSMEWSAYLLGAITAFISGWWACRWMIRWVKSARLNAFAVYCLIAGVVTIVIL